MSDGGAKPNGEISRAMSGPEASSGGAKLAMSGVSTPPGATALMRNPTSRYSTASA
jgi:hypothetical protein